MSSSLKLGNPGKTFILSVVGETVAVRKLPEKHSCCPSSLCCLTASRKNCECTRMRHAGLTSLLGAPPGAHWSLPAENWHPCAQVKVQISPIVSLAMP